LPNDTTGQFKARDIRESSEFVQQKERIQSDARRSDEQLFAVTWALSRKPESFPKVGKSNLHCMKTDPWPDAPRLRVYYTFDDDLVNLLWIEIAAPSD
jgi:hypothetical protein